MTDTLVAASRSAPPPGHTRRWLVASVLMPLVFVIGCAALGMRPEPPVVSLVGVRPLNLSLTKQELEFTLNVANPNAFELPVRSLEFIASIGDERIAKGESTGLVTIPPNGEAELAVVVSAGIDQVLGRFRRMLEERTIELDYRVAGNVKLDNWPRRIPFDVSRRLTPGGVIDPDEQSR